MKSKINSVIQEIRNCFNEPYKFNATEDKDVYFSALDVLEDTLEAIDYYKKNDLIENTGYKYLVIHGLLESLYMQQEAVKDLYGFLFDEQLRFGADYPEIYNIREIRNDISGHPTSRGKYSTYLNRASLKKDGFNYTKNLTGEPICVNTSEIIKKQEEFLVEFLSEKILKPLKKERDEHYKAFQDTKLIKCFEGLDYANEKVYVPGRFYTKEDSLGFSIVEGILGKFEDKLNERYIDWRKSDCSYEIQNVHDIIDCIKSHQLIMDEVDEEQRFIKLNLLENLFTKMHKLYEIAKAIDEKYERYFEPEEKHECVELPKVIIKDENGEEVELNV